MTEAEAKKKAEELVFVDYTAPDIIWACEERGIQTRTKSGTFRSRSVLEAALIKAMTNEFMENQ